MKNIFPYFLAGSIVLLLIFSLDFSVSPNYMLGTTNKADIPTGYQREILNHLFEFFYTSLIIGLCFFLGIIAFFQGIFSKDNTYVLWSFYLICNSFFFFAGLDYNFKLNLISGSLHLSPIHASRPWTITVQYFVAMGYLSFIMSFLKLKLHDLKLYKFISVLQMVLVVIGVLSFFGVKNYLYTTELDILVFIIFFALFFIFVRIIKLQIPQKKLLMIGSMGVLVFGIYAGFIDQMSLVKRDVFFQNPFYLFSIGILFELMFFSLALSQRNIQIQIENQELQQKYTLELEDEIKSRTSEIEHKNKELENQKILKLTGDFEQKIAETEISALRSQMNPHFIFNCLNSIKLYTLENDSKSASEYLTKFSKLIRMVLENSRSEKITLASELETLELYIQMEAMRFKNKVKYDISIDKEIDVHYIEIPPLLIQPYVENAIWHGLMQKTEGGHVHISVRLPKEQTLQFEILDNGIGREKAMDFKSKSAMKNKSFGMKVTDERLQLINQMYKIKTEIEIIDLKDEQNLAIGTKVILNVPI